VQYRILSLSGGGVRGIFQAACLKEISNLYGKGPIGECFNLIAGTSTGAIIAMAVAFDKDMTSVVDLFRKHASTIFAPRTFAGLRKGPRYRPEVLRNALVDVFGSSKLKDCQRDVIIAATTLNRFAIRVFTTLDRKPSEPDKELTVVDVIMASCAAPTFFPPVRPIGSERDYVDGGLWANTPSVLAVMQAHAYVGEQFSNMRVVKLGNGKFPEGTIGEEFKTVRPYSPSTILALFDMMFATQDSAADDYLKKLVGPQNSYEIDVQLPRAISLDDAQTAITILPALAEDIARNQFNDLESFLGVKQSFSVVATYFDGINRSILSDLSFGHGDDSKATPLATTDLVKIENEGTVLRIERLHRDYRWLISIRNYQNTASAPANTCIPADSSVALQEEYIRFIRVRFRARVLKLPQVVTVRLRKPNHNWLKSGVSEDKDATRDARITSPDWSLEEFLLGPIRAGQPCIVGLEIGAGPTGKSNQLLIKDLEIHELRPK
jgi:predicted acylesterase/phospholipase RssA